MAALFSKIRQNSLNSFATDWARFNLTYWIDRLLQSGHSAVPSEASREGHEMNMDDLWLPTLKTDTPQDGLELAVKLSDLGFMVSQRSEDNRPTLRTTHKCTQSQLIAAAHVIALNFQTVAAANDWWRHRSNVNGGE